MKLKSVFPSSLTILILLTSCAQSNVDLSEKPKDFKCDYWLGETINTDELDDSSFYTLKYDTVYTYLDSNYTFEIEKNIKSMPNYYVSYDIYVEDKISIIQSLFITDPEVSIYGLSLKSNSSTIKMTLSNMGFEYLDQYSGWYPSFSKDKYLFTFTEETIILSCLLSY